MEQAAKSKVRRMKPPAPGGVSWGTGYRTMHFFDFIFFLGGAAAAGAVGVMCVICLVVWLSGRNKKHPGEAWRPADEL